MKMRLMAIVAGGLLSACTSDVVTVPDQPVITEVPPAGTASTFDTEPLPLGVQQAPAGVSTAVAAPGVGRPLDTDTLNLMQTTLEEQKIDAAMAERKLAADRAQLVVVQPGALPDRVEGVNIALFAQQTSNAVGQRLYRRSGNPVSAAAACRRFKNPDDAQRAFLANGGPQADRGGLDPDGDGFACSWDPTPFRQLNG